MRKKISPGLVATSGDGKPSIHPRVPAHWSGQPAPSSANEKDDMKPSTANNSGPPSMEDPAGSSQEPSSPVDGTAVNPTDSQTPSCSTPMSSTETTTISNGEPLTSTQENASQSIPDPLPSSNNSPPVSDNLELAKEPMEPQSSNREDSAQSSESATIIDAEFGSSGQVEDKDSGETPSAPIADSGDTSIGLPSHETVTIVKDNANDDKDENVNILDDEASSLSEKSVKIGEAECDSSNQPPPPSTAPSSRESKKENEVVDLVSLTIASVAAGEGEITPPQSSVMRDPQMFREATFHSNHHQLSIPSSASNKHSECL